MDERDVFVLADQTLNAVIEQIKDNEWQMEMPPTFARRGSDHTPTLREIIDYHAYDDAWMPDMLAGKTMDEVGRTTFDGDLLGDDPKGRFSDIVQKACAAARQLDDLDRVVHLSFGDY